MFPFRWRAWKEKVSKHSFLSRISRCLYFLKICIFYQTLPICHWTDQYILGPGCSRSPIGPSRFSDHLNNGPRAGNFPITMGASPSGARLGSEPSSESVPEVVDAWDFLPTKIGIGTLGFQSRLLYIYIIFSNMFQHSRKDHVEDPFGFSKKAIKLHPTRRLDGFLKRCLGLAEVGLGGFSSSYSGTQKTRV